MAALYDSMSIDSMSIDHFERERALRIVEKQRGALSNTRVTNSKMTTSRHRQIAEHWDDIVWPRLVETLTGDPSSGTPTYQRNPTAVASEEHTGANVKILLGDFRDRLNALSDGSVDLILTDPPYPKDDLPLYSDLAKHAARLLGPRGLNLPDNTRISVTRFRGCGLTRQRRRPQHTSGG